MIGRYKVLRQVDRVERKIYQVYRQLDRVERKIYKVDSKIDSWLKGDR